MYGPVRYARQRAFPAKADIVSGPLHFFKADVRHVKGTAW